MQYNNEQLQVVNTDAANSIIVACPGSGKTFSIVGAIHHHLQLHPMDHICAITFTRKAAEELAARIQNPAVEVSTIHSWSYRRLQALGRKYGFRIQLLEEAMIKDILKKLCVKRRQLYINQWLLYSYVMGNYHLDIDEKIEKIFKIISADYVHFKRANKLYDFTDLPLYLCDVCKEYDETINDSPILFVDEFQDIDPIQLQVFDFVQTKRRMYIGDPKQAIYAFRGACSQVFDEFRNDDWTWFNLSTNYRSKQNIIDFAERAYQAASNALLHKANYSFIRATEIDEIPISTIEASRGTGGAVMVVEDFCGEYLAEQHWLEMSENTTEAEIARLLNNPRTQILCRSNKQVKKLQTLGIENVSTVHQAKGLEYDTVIMVEFPISTEEELNISYVAATRAKNELCIIDWDMLLYFVANRTEEEKQQASKRLF